MKFSEVECRNVALNTRNTLPELRTIARCLRYYMEDPNQSLDEYIKECEKEGMAPLGWSFLNAWDHSAMTGAQWDKVWDMRNVLLEDE